MTDLSPTNFYAPRHPSAMDTLQYARQKVDELVRANPLQNAMISSGLMRWVGRYPRAGGPGKIDFLWIGELLPADPDMGGRGQQAFALNRDDTRGGVTALAMYDPLPNFGGSGLRQVLIMTSGDGKRLMEESRDGGQRWPEENVSLGPIGDSAQQWPGTSSGTFLTLWEGRANLVGNKLRYRMFCYNDPGVAAEYRMRVSLAGGDTVGATHVLGTGAQDVFEADVDVSAGRGSTVTVRWEARATAGGTTTNKARSSLITVRCYTP